MAAPAKKSLQHFSVLAKNLKTSKKVIIKSTELLQVDIETYTHNDFHPHNKKDFVEKKAYGRIEKNYLVLYYIMFMDTCSREELGRKIKDPTTKRIHDPKVEMEKPFDFPIKKFSVAKEIQDVKSDKKALKKAVTTAKTQQGSQTIDRLLKRTSSTVNPVPQRKQSTESSTDSDEEVKNPQKVSLKSKVIPPLKGNCEGQCPKAKKLDKQLKLALNELEMQRTENCDLKDKVAELSRRLIKANEQIKDFSNSQSEMWTPAQVNDKLNEILSKVDELPGKMTVTNQATTSGELKCALSQIKSVVSVPEEEIESLDLTDEQVYAGDGLILDKKAIMDISSKHSNLGTRVTELCLLFYKDRAADYGLSGKSPKQNLELIKMPPTHIAALTEIVLKMSWPPDMKKKVDPVAIRRQVTHSLNELRAKRDSALETGKVSGKGKKDGKLKIPSAGDKDGTFHKKSDETSEIETDETASKEDVSTRGTINTPLTPSKSNETAIGDLNDRNDFPPKDVTSARKTTRPENVDQDDPAACPSKKRKLEEKTDDNTSSLDKLPDKTTEDSEKKSMDSSDDLSVEDGIFGDEEQNKSGN